MGAAELGHLKGGVPTIGREGWHQHAYIEATILGFKDPVVETATGRLEKTKELPGECLTACGTCSITSFGSCSHDE